MDLVKQQQSYFLNVCFGTWIFSKYSDGCYVIVNCSIVGAAKRHSPCVLKQASRRIDTSAWALTSVAAGKKWRLIKRCGFSGSRHTLVFGDTDIDFTGTIHCLCVTLLISHLQWTITVGFSICHCVRERALTSAVVESCSGFIMTSGPEHGGNLPSGNQLGNRWIQDTH